MSWRASCRKFSQTGIDEDRRIGAFGEDEQRWRWFVQDSSHHQKNLPQISHRCLQTRSGWSKEEAEGWVRSEIDQGAMRLARTRCFYDKYSSDSKFNVIGLMLDVRWNGSSHYLCNLHFMNNFFIFVQDKDGCRLSSVVCLLSSPILNMGLFPNTLS